MKYKKLTGVILKKQNYGEADQIISVWTKEAGKIRCLARSLRLPKSKLNYALQDLSLVTIEIAGKGNLPTLIGATTIKHYKSFTSDLLKMINAFYAAELMLKMTADEHPSTPAYRLLVEFLEELESTQLADTFTLVDKFSLDLASVLGFGKPQKVKSHIDVRSFIETLIERNLKSESLLNQIF